MKWVHQSYMKELFKLFDHFGVIKKNNSQIEKSKIVYNDDSFYC